MAKVSVSLFATLRERSGESHLEEEASDVDELMARLSDRFGRGFSQLLESPSRDALVVLVNGRNIVQLDGYRTSLKDGDEVAMFPPISGG